MLSYSQLGENWVVNPDVCSEIEAFTCIMYGYNKENSINAVRSKMLKKMVGEDQGLDKTSKIDLARLPPCQDSLIPHINRVNYRISCYKRANIPIFETPKPYEEDQGWTIDATGIIEPKWTKGSVLPQSLIDLLATTTEDDDEGEDEMEMEVDEFDENDDDNEDSNHF